jgi:hypothetical protein
MVESGWFMVFPFAEVPFAHHCCLVTACAEMLGDVRNVLVDLGVEGYDAVDVVVGSREDCCPRWRTDAVGHVAVIEFHAFGSQAIEVGGVVDSCAVAGYRFGGMVIGHDEDDIGAWVGRHPESTALVAANLLEKHLSRRIMRIGVKVCF